MDITEVLTYIFGAFIYLIVYTYLGAIATIILGIYIFKRALKNSEDEDASYLSKYHYFCGAILTLFLGLFIIYSKITGNYN